MNVSISTLTILILSILSLIPAKALSQSVISVAGEENEAGGNIISWTIGEVITETFENSGTRLSQGFHTGDILETGVIEEFDYNAINISPNPVSEILRIEITIDIDPSMSIVITDLIGKEVKRTGVTDRITEIFVSDLPSGLYYLTIEKNNSQYLLSTKIIKI